MSPRVFLVGVLFCLLFAGNALSQEPSLEASDVICTDVPASQLHADHIEDTSLRLLCEVPGTTIGIHLLRAGLNRLAAGTMQVILQGADEGEDGRNRAETISLMQVLPRVWQVRHFNLNGDRIFVGEHQLAWVEDIHQIGMTSNFSAQAFEAHRVFRCYGEVLEEFPDSIERCITFYRSAVCNLSPMMSVGIERGNGYPIVSVRASTRSDVLLMLENYTVLHQIAARFAEEIQNANCGFEAVSDHSEQG